MSKYGDYFRTGKSLVSAFSGEKPHSSITDWIEVLSSDRYDDNSLDGVPELVESINIQGPQGTGEAARAIRKKLKYGNVHRQIRALTILRALTDNCGHGFQVNWNDQQIMERLRLMAQDSLIDPKVRKRLVLVFHAWSIQYADEPRMRDVAGLYKQYAGGGKPQPPTQHQSRPSQDASHGTATSPTHARGFSESEDIFKHSWEVAPGQRGKDTYADLATARADADQRKREREAQIALEHREAEVERREREVGRKKEMEEIEARRRREAAEEEERRRKAKAERKAAKHAPQRPKFNFEREKPVIMNSVATAIQAANNLVNACRQINREAENITENPRVQNGLDKAKAARRPIIRYIQQVTDEEYIGTLLDANEKIVEAIQLYDKLSKPAALDSDSENESSKPRVDGAEADQVERIRQRLQAQKLEANRTGELQALQDAQKMESKRQQARTLRRGNSGAVFDDLAGLDFKASDSLPTPMRPDSAAGSYDGDGNSGPSLSDFSDYDSSDDEYRAAVAKSRGHSRQNSRQQASYSEFDQYAPSGSYNSLDDEGSKGLLDPNDPFGDPFGDDNAPTPKHEKQRMEWAEI